MNIYSKDALNLINLLPPFVQTHCVRREHCRKIYCHICKRLIDTGEINMMIEWTDTVTGRRQGM